MDLKALLAVLVLALTVGGISSVGGCFADPEEVSEVGESALDAIGPTPSTDGVEEATDDSRTGDALGDDAVRTGSTAIRAARSPAVQAETADDVDLDPFGLLSGGVGFEVYSTNCELTDDPFADCL